MFTRVSVLSLLCVTVLVTPATFAQQTQSPLLLQPAVESTVPAPTQPATPSNTPVPLQSAVTAKASSLVTVDESAALAAAVAGTCTVIDALLMEICVQTPNDDYCRR
jgi:hypothetical protein